MGRQVAVALYVVAMAAVIVGVDFVFFRNRSAPACQGSRFEPEIGSDRPHLGNTGEDLVWARAAPRPEEFAGLESRERASLERFRPRRSLGFNSEVAARARAPDDQRQFSHAEPLWRTKIRPRDCFGDG